jgi:hypothetical protein
MPIRPENRWLYPIDWRQLSQTVRFDRAGARCEACSRPHLRRVVHLGDGRWWDADIRCWRSDRGKRISMKAGFALASVRVTYVVLACAHLDHDPGNSASSNLKALCQRCHMIHDAAEHRRQRWSFGSARSAISTRILASPASASLTARDRCCGRASLRLRDRRSAPALPTLHGLRRHRDPRAYLGV